MAVLIPFNRRNGSLASTGFENFYNMLDDFFSDGAAGSRNLLRDTFKIDIIEKDAEYLVEAELPGIKKEEVDLNIEGETLSISVNRSNETGGDTVNYIHRERRSASMMRNIRLANAKLDAITAGLENGVLIVTIPKDLKSDSPRKINIK